ALGSVRVRVRAVDPHGAASDPLEMEVIFTGPLSTIDLDGDGYPASLDCDDGDGAIHPGAVDDCHDLIDQDCSGSANTACDDDGDGYVAAASGGDDCDDADPAVHPGAFERCDGVDDDCEGHTDEGYALGGACVAGVGACARAGVWVCAAGGLGTVC